MNNFINILSAENFLNNFEKDWKYWDNIVLQAFPQVQFTIFHNISKWSIALQNVGHFDADLNNSYQKNKANFMLALLYIPKQLKKL